MSLGEVKFEDLDSIDFTLPNDPESNSGILATGDGSFEFRLGAPKWGAREWRGTLYPADTKEKDNFNEYLKRFNYLEMGTTFYNMPDREQLRFWGEKTLGHDIRFNIKMNQVITHAKKLHQCGPELATFFNGISQFGPNIGRVWMQVPENLEPKDIPYTFEVLENLPADYRYFIEFRNAEIFADQKVFNDLNDVLTNLKIGLIINDVAGRRDLAHMTLIVPETMIRFVGNANHSSLTSRITAWADRIGKWREQGLEKVYFTYDQDDYRTYGYDFRIAEYIFEKAGLYKSLA